MASPQRLIAFLRDCYEADNRESAIFDLLDDRVRHLALPLLGWDLVCGRLDRVPVERESALAAAREAELHQTEKSLVFAAFLLVGGRVGREHRSLCAPLMYYPARVEDAEPNAFLHVDLNQGRLNTRVLAALREEDGTEELDRLAGQLPELPLGPGGVDELAAALGQVLPELDLEPLSLDPRSVDLEALHTAAARRGRVRLLPATALALVPNSPDTREVLAELASLAGSPALGPPLQALLGPCRSCHPSRPPRPLVPASLSSAQQQVLASGSTRDLTLIVGPPGTGKSFTIAALAVDHALRGQSVLIGARTDQALDVVEDKLRALAGGEFLLVRGGRGPRARELRELLGQLLGGLALPAEAYDAAAVRRTNGEVHRLGRTVSAAARHLERRARLELAWADVAAVDPAARSLLERVRGRFLGFRLGHRPPYRDEMVGYLRDLDEHEAAIARHLRCSTQHRLARTLARHRQDLVALDRALRARTKRKLAEHFADLDRDVLLTAFPIWLTTLADVGSLLPLEAGLFDLAVVDEATQCDQACALPVLHRARRAAVTGDPHQLRHVSFLSEARLDQIGSRHGLDQEELVELHWRRHSLLDLVSDHLGTQDQVLLLDEHFRSQPRIIAFSNREFYRNRLRVMTQRPETVRRSSLELRLVDGRRDSTGVNREEARLLVEELVTRVEAERGVTPPHSIGVLSPFRAQVDYLTGLVLRRLDSAAIARHRLLVGTAHGFQGDERDMMLLSLTVDPSSNPGCHRFLAREDVFNVAVTRARDLQVVFCSVSPEHLPAGLLRRYLDHVRAKASCEPQPPAVDDPYLAEVADALRDRGFRTWPAYPVAGREVDLVVEKNGRSLGLDLVGQPGPWSEPFSLERYRVARRAGLRLVPLPLEAWRRDRERCLAAVEAALHSTC